jgi:hypothetical protein
MLTLLGECSASQMFTFLVLIRIWLTLILKLLVIGRMLLMFGCVGCLLAEVKMQGGKLLGLLLTGSTGQHMAGRNGLA